LHKRIISAVKRVEFVSDKMLYIILRGRWCHIIILNVHAPTEDITDDVKDSFYEELECVFDKFRKYLMKIVLGDFNVKVGREDFLNQELGMKVYDDDDDDDNGVRVVNFASVSKVRCSHITTSINILGCIQMGKPTIRLLIFW
jgi:hypothetical protein